VSRWLRLFFGLLALFGPAAFPVEASTRPVAVAVGGSKAAPVVVAAREPRVGVERPEWPVPSSPRLEGARSERPLYLLNRALLR